MAVAADLNDLDAVASLAETAQTVFGRLDIVVNNVGGAMPRAFMDTSPGFMERAFHFNVSTAHALTRAAVPLMLAGDGGAVVNISSSMGRFAGRGYAAYGTAKAALSHYTRLAAKDLAPRIRVNAIAVGATATSALEVVVSDDNLRTAMEICDAARAHRRRRGHLGGRPLPRLARRLVPHGQGDRGRRRHRAAERRPRDPRPVNELIPGLYAKVEKEVTTADTALMLGSGDVEVFGTPAVIALCELAAVHAVAPALGPNETTVGTHIDIEHLAPTVVGRTVTGYARVEQRRRTAHRVHGRSERSVRRDRAGVARPRARGSRSVHGERLGSMIGCP